MIIRAKFTSRRKPADKIRGEDRRSQPYPIPVHHSYLFDFESGLLAFIGFLLFVASAQRRNPPRNALALSPARQPGGSSFSFFDVTPAEDRIIGFESGDQAGYHIGDIFPPILLAELPN